MANNSEGSRSIRSRILRNPISASDGEYGQDTDRGVRRMPRHSRGNEHYLVTETEWRAASAGLSLGLVVGALGTTGWWQVVIHR
jgi:hypothetical protein